MTKDEAKQLVDYLTKYEDRIIRDIGRQYKTSLDKMIAELSRVYMKSGSDELSFADVNRFNDLARLENLVIQQADKLHQQNRSSVLGLLIAVYIYAFDAQKGSIETGVKKAIGRPFPLSDTPDAKVIRLMQSRPSSQVSKLLDALEKDDIRGLKLDPALERNRNMIIQDIKQALERGFIEKKGYTAMAKDIQNAFDMSFNRATTIAQTEGHRVRETASYDSAMNANAQGIKMQKSWMNMGDSRVRHRPGANHVVMEGQTREVDQSFDLGWGIQAQVPSQSGDPANDIRCRCIALYKIVGIDPSLNKLKKGMFSVD
ncbi:phage minor head protein [Sporolactobacillus pectinivorans]|uniref:phage minor head protein n=1 Tax=Sporolactobacillus pectinivorans TaxID=1591408 RepID=UPI000C2687B4|nr:phage minor head protein [Sporolactobacillus pectinivorans]